MILRSQNQQFFFKDQRVLPNLIYRTPLNADEIIVSSSGGFCTGAYEIDGKAVGGKDNASLVKLQQAYDEFYKKDIGLI